MNQVKKTGIFPRIPVMIMAVVMVLGSISLPAKTADAADTIAACTYTTADVNVLKDEPKNIYEPEKISAREAMDYKKNGGKLVRTADQSIPIGYALLICVAAAMIVVAFIEKNETR